MNMTRLIASWRKAWGQDVVASGPRSVMPGTTIRRCRFATRRVCLRRRSAETKGERNRNG